MDAARYARVRELFLAAEDMAAGDRERFLRSETGEDQELLNEVCSLLQEHDPDAAKREGEQSAGFARNAIARQALNAGGSVRAASQSSTASESTEQGTRSRRSHDKVSNSIGTSPSQTGGKDPQRDSVSVKPRSSSALLWAQQTRRSRRRNNKWLWLAALLPTALIGWFTYDRVNSTMEQSVRDELRGIADSMSHATRRFLIDKSRLVESWSRQPGVQSSVIELVELERGNPQSDELRNAAATGLLEAQLRNLSDQEEVQFVVWSDTFRTLASSEDRLAAVGEPVSPRDAEMIASVMTGQTVIFGPQRIDLPGRSGTQAPELPVMAIVVPVSNDEGQVVAALLVGGTEMFDEFSRMFFDVANAGNLDAYAVNEAGIMVTESPRAATLASMKKLDASVEEIAARLRVADPGTLLNSNNIGQVQRATSPPTASVASVTSGSSTVRIDPYRNYAGQLVVGAWRWNSDSNLGIIAERQADAAFAAVRIVRSSFLLLGTLLFITASMAAAFLARASTAERVAVHPLSRYEVLRELGSGGMGQVYLARHRQLGRDTALKVMIGDRRDKQDQLRFDREARLAASLSNPHSVMIYDYGRSEDGESYCVMEFLRGLTLQEVVERSGSQPIGRALFVISQVCEALNEAHSLNLLHRDIKPQNIMLSLDQSVGDWAVLFDYGLAKPLGSVVDTVQSSETHWSGTPTYMAPERFRQSNSMDRRSDIYSLGCVAYFLLSGRPPFIEHETESLFALILSEQPMSISQQRQESVPDEISQLVFRCMSKRPDDRFESISQLADAIASIHHRYPWTVEDAKRWWKDYGDEAEPVAPADVRGNSIADPT